MTKSRITCVCVKAHCLDLRKPSYADVIKKKLRNIILWKIFERMQLHNAKLLTVHFKVWNVTIIIFVHYIGLCLIIYAGGMKMMYLYVYVMDVLNK